MYNNLTAFESLLGEQCLAATMRRAHRSLVGRYDDALRTWNLTTAQLDMLATLLTAPADMRPIDLAATMGLERSSIARNLARLQQRGVVAMQPGKNGRESRIRVTVLGRETVERAAEGWREAQRQVREQLGPDGVAALALIKVRLESLQREDES